MPKRPSEDGNADNGVNSMRMQAFLHRGKELVGENFSNSYTLALQAGSSEIPRRC